MKILLRYITSSAKIFPVGAIKFTCNPVRGKYAWRNISRTGFSSTDWEACLCIPDSTSEQALAPAWPVAEEITTIHQEICAPMHLWCTEKCWLCRPPMDSIQCHTISKTELPPLNLKANVTCMRSPRRGKIEKIRTKKMRKEIPPPVSHWPANQKREKKLRKREKAKILTKASARQSLEAWPGSTRSCYVSVPSRIKCIWYLPPGVATA